MSLLLLGSVTFLVMDWLPLTTVGPIAIKSQHIFAALIVTYLFATTRLILPRLSRLETLVVAGYMARFVILLASTLWSDNMGGGLVLIFRDLIYFIACLAFVFAFRTLPLATIQRHFFIGGLIGIVLFYSITMLANLSSGRNGPGILFEAITTGNLRQIKAQYFYGSLKGLGIAGLAGLGGTITVKITNSIGASMMIVAIAAWSYGNQRSDHLQTRTMRRHQILIGLIMLNALFAMLWSFSTRVQIFGLWFFALSIGFFLLYARNRSERYAALFTLALGLAVILYVLSLPLVQQQIGIFLVDFLDDPRFVDLQIILAQINDGGFLGYGYGTPMDLPGIPYSYPHNIFLSDMHSFGTIGLFTSLLWVGMLVIATSVGIQIAFSRQSGYAAQRVGLGAAMILGYTVLLTQLAGAGTFDLSDWVGLAIGLTMLQNATQLRKAYQSAT